jgi:hypothetical protein
VRQLLVIILLLVLTACGGGSGSTPTPTTPAPIPSADACNALGSTPPTSGTAILNGSACSPERSPVVLLNMRRDDGAALGACSGTVVGPRAILTAAHCLDEGVQIVRVWLGPPNLEINAGSWVFYPGYVFNRPDLYDVGVIFMNEDLPRTPVAILTSRDGRSGETAIVAGWGRDQNAAGATLRAGSTTLSAVGPSLLETLYRPPSSSICSGDSGGPILLQEGGAWTIGGITSATSDNICNTGTNFYQAVRHPSVRAFILQQVPAIGQR